MPRLARRKAPAQIRAAIEKLTKAIIPADPTPSAFDRGNTIEPEHRAWRRARCLQQSGILSRHDKTSGIIVCGRVNDADTKSASGSKTDACRVFEARLAAGDPAADWSDLIERAAPVERK